MREDTKTTFQKKKKMMKKIYRWQKSSENVATDSWAVKLNYDINTVINTFIFFATYFVPAFFGYII